MLEADNSELQQESLGDASVRRMRLLRIGVRNKDTVTLDAVKDDLIKSFGEQIGERVYDGLLFQVISDLNKEDIRRNYPEIDLI